MGEFSESYPPITDGVAVVVANYARNIHQFGGDVFVVTPRVPGNVDRHPFPVHRYSSTPIPGMAPYRFGWPSFDGNLKNLLKAQVCDIVHAHCPFSSGRLAVRFARERGIPVVATMHTRYFMDFRRIVRSERLAAALVRRVARFYEAVDYVWVPTEAAARLLESYGYRGDITVQPNGTDLSPPSVDEFRWLRAKGRSITKSAAEADVALYVGQVRREKGVGLLVEALAALRRVGGPCPKLVVVGGGPDSAEFVARASRLGVTDSVVFLGQVRDRLNLRALYAAADFFVFPSSYDTDGIVVKEAAAFALPSIVISGSGPATQVRNGHNGVVCQRCSESLARAMRHLIEHRSIRQRIGRCAQETLYLPFERVVRQVYGRYVAILEQQRRKPVSN